MSDWVDVTKARMAILGLRQTDLMSALGVATRGAVGHYLTRRRSPTPDQLKALASLLHLSVGQLMDGDAHSETSVREVSTHYQANGNAPPSPEPTVPKGFVRFPLLEGYAGAQRGDYVGDYPEIVKFVEVTKEWAASKLHNVPDDAIRVMTGRGQSMQGMYSDGDLIFLDSRVKRFVDDAAYAFRYAGRVQVKRLQWIGGKLRILSANPAYAPLDVEEVDLDIGAMAIATWTLKEF